MKSKDPLEKHVTKKIRDYLKSLTGVWHYKNHAGMGMAQAGIPDIIGCIKSRVRIMIGANLFGEVLEVGVFFAIEVKRISGNVTALQEHTMKEIILTGGGFVIVGFGFDDFKLKFDKFYKEVVNDG